ncbi:MAG: shikimate dehydrogenase [candidate division KSB1 bacterium]|nr:shikimate dehydrogenase [candidate division KSB1 bacterium]
MVDACTRTLGLVGDPVEHSLSPLLQGLLIEALGLNWCYHAFRVRAADLPAAVAGLRALGVMGVNVTIPHKQAIVPLLDELAPEARALGAVNVVVNEQGRLVGYNTDVVGVTRALRLHGVSAQGKNVVVLGAGGAARAAVWALAQQGAAGVRVHARSIGRGQQLVHELSSTSHTTELVVLPWDEEALRRSLATADLAVNATPVGMWPHHGQSPVPGSFFHSGMVAFDLVYNPLRTAMIRQAEKAGAQVISGLEMFIFQGLEAMALWSGRRPADEDGLYQRLRARLSEELGAHG